MINPFEKLPLCSAPQAIPPTAVVSGQFAYVGQFCGTLFPIKLDFPGFLIMDL